MVPARCRCGGMAAKCCAKCGNSLNAIGACYSHPTLDTATVCCSECREPLCFFHFVLGPTIVDGKATARPRCFPSCEHKFRATEKRPAEVRL